MVYHYHKYERVENNFNIEVNQLIKDSPESRKSTRDLDWEENNLGFEDLFLKKILTKIWFPHPVFRKDGSAGIC